MATVIYLQEYLVLPALNPFSSSPSPPFSLQAKVHSKTLSTMSIWIGDKEYATALTSEAVIESIKRAHTGFQKVTNAVSYIKTYDLHGAFTVR